MSHQAASDVAVVELSSGEGAAMFDRLVRREMGLSGEEFLQQWDAGEYQDVDFDTVPGLVEVWMYLPFVR